MSIDTVTLFFALLAVALQVALGVVAVAALRPSWRRSVVSTLGPAAPILAAAIALGATFGSLYLSEIAKFTPCKFCWFQRIAMYPAALLLAVAVARRDRTVTRHVAPLLVVGAFISTYHVLLERFPSLDSGSCDPTNPCSLIWFEKFGYITIPVMALTSFVSILVLLGIHHLWSANDRPASKESL
jgi:Disulfide bond formation protein DsbB